MSVPNSTTSGVHLWLLLMKAHRALQKYALRSISGSGLCFSDFAVLEVLLHKGPLPVNTVGTIVSLTSGPATAAIDRLEKKGLVRRAADSEDRRARIVHLTEKGKTLISAAFRQHEADMETLTSQLSAADKSTLSGLLKKLGKLAETE